MKKKQFPVLPSVCYEDLLFKPRINNLPEKKYIKNSQQFREEIRVFSKEHILTSALETDWRIRTGDHDYVPWEIIKSGMRKGFLSMLYPKAVGGQGGTTTKFAIFMEEMSAGCPGIANIFGANALGAASLIFSLNMELWARYLVPAVKSEKKGKPVIFAWAITEPSAGSDVEYLDGLKKGAIYSEAKPVVGGYRLNGRKVFISNGSIADYILVKMPLNRKKADKTWSTFIVPSNAVGFKVVRTENKMGQVATPAAEIEFDDVFVPSNDMIGKPGSGFNMAKMILAASRGPVGAIGTGIALGAFRLAVAYASDSETPLERSLQNSAVVELLAELFNKIRLSRLSYIEASSNFDKNILPPMWLQDSLKYPFGGLQKIMIGNSRTKIKEFGDELLEKYFKYLISSEKLDSQLIVASSAKVIGGDTAMFVTKKILDLIIPSSSAYWIGAQKLYRDAKLIQIYEGTNQLNKQEIGNNLKTGKRFYNE